MATVGFESYKMDSTVQSNPLRSPSPQTDQQHLLANDKPFPHYGQHERANNLFFRDGKRRIDFVLAFQTDDDSDEDWSQTRAEKRDIFQAGLEERGLQLEEESKEVAVDQKTSFVKVHAPFKVLTRWAEELLINMPIDENNVISDSLLDKIIDKCCSNVVFEPDIEPQPDEFTAPFLRSKLTKYLHHEDEDGFFTPAQRSYIVFQIMSRTPYVRVTSRSQAGTKIGIDRLVANKSYTAAFPLHEGGYANDQPDNMRKDLYRVWGRWAAWYKIQPLDHIRTYFGEKIGIYFVWLGFYTLMLALPALIGFIVFLIGCVTINNNQPAKEICEIKVRNQQQPPSQGDTFVHVW